MQSAFALSAPEYPVTSDSYRAGYLTETIPSKPHNFGGSQMALIHLLNNVR